MDERGPAEMGELARTFNVMATSLEENRDQLESQNAELEASQGELEHAVEQLAEEKRQVEVLHRFGERLQEHAELEPLAAAALDDLCELAAARSARSTPAAATSARATAPPCWPPTGCAAIASRRAWTRARAPAAGRCRSAPRSRSATARPACACPPTARTSWCAPSCTCR